MKGFTHFISGVATATFFQSAVHMANDPEKTSLILVLGGIFGILPDTLDFKVGKFFEKVDYEIDPGNNLDVQKVAEEIAKIVDSAYEKDEMVTLHLHTIKLNSDLFQRYSIRFDENQVVVTAGPTVNMGQVPVKKSEIEGQVGIAKTKHKLIQTYDTDTHVDIFGGPDFGFIRKGNAIEIQFIPWHRNWSHSLTLGLIFGILGYLFISPLAGMIITSSFWVHVLEDQLGFMGSNLFWPITKERFQGLKLIRSGDAMPNFFTAWSAIAIILFNLNRFSPNPAFENICFYKYFSYTVIIPMIIIGFLLKISSRLDKKFELSDSQIKYNEMVAEIEDGY